jgi:murein DD-endopeptidase MepM/ murein hydrolase activator NlpD
VLGVLFTASVASSSHRLPVAPPIIVTNAYVQVADTVRRNETLSHLFGRHNIYGAELATVLGEADGLNPRRIRSGQVFDFRYLYGADKPDRVTFRLGDERTVRLARDTWGDWNGWSDEILWHVHVERAQGVISSSLYEAVDEVIADSLLPAGQRHYMVEDLADGVFGWVIDFYRDSYPGDKFAFAYERLTSQYGDIRYGRVLAAKVETRGKENYAYVMTDERGRNVYYDGNGRSLKRTLKIRPIAFGQLISRYSKSRFHPILKTYRPHYGIDYAAPAGARIEATGDGTVTRAGRWGTYGIMVAIRHTNGIETRYAHMRGLGPGIETGVRVEQGQTVGYVGMTGLATGHHVHYELLRNGKHIDPRTLGTEPGPPVSADRRAEFEAIRAHYARMLDFHQAATVAVAPDR